MLIDTNILILFSKGDKEVTKKLLGFSESLIISRINYIEFLADKKMNSGDRRRSRSFLMNMFETVELTQDIADRGIDLRLRFDLKLPDAIILATALTLKCGLFTKDKRLNAVYAKVV